MFIFSQIWRHAGLFCISLIISLQIIILLISCIIYIISKCVKHKLQLEGAIDGDEYNNNNNDMRHTTFVYDWEPVFLLSTTSWNKKLFGVQTLKKENPLYDFWWFKLNARSESSSSECGNTSLFVSPSDKAWLTVLPFVSRINFASWTPVTSVFPPRALIASHTSRLHIFYTIKNITGFPWPIAGQKLRICSPIKHP